MNKKTIAFLISTISVVILSFVYLYPFEQAGSLPNRSISIEPIGKDQLHTTSTDIDSKSGVAQAPQSSMKIQTSNISYNDYRSTFGPLPKSLRGTHIPASFTLDEAGHLIVTSSLKSVIEYFLSANGEESIDTIIGRIEEFLTQQLNEPASSEALEILSQYIEYKTNLVDLEKTLAENTQLSGKSSDYLTMFQYRREARLNSLSAEVYEAFFAAEDKEDNYTASLLEIRKNQDLSDEQKAAQYIEAELSLPPKEQAARQAERSRERLRQDIEQARAQGATDEQIFQMRSELYDYETAERFAAADKKKAQWNNRFELYQTRKQNILDTTGLSDDDKANAIYELQSTMFHPREQRRLATLDQMQNSK